MKFSELREANLSKAQIKKVHDKADDLPKSDFIKRYGKEGDAVRFATATNQVKKELGLEGYSTGTGTSRGRQGDGTYPRGYDPQAIPITLPTTSLERTPKSLLQKIFSDLDKEDEKTIKPIIKQLQKSVKAHGKQAKQLQKDIKDETELDEFIAPVARAVGKAAVPVAKAVGKAAVPVAKAGGKLAYKGAKLAVKKGTPIVKKVGKEVGKAALEIGVDVAKAGGKAGLSLAKKAGKAAVKTALNPTGDGSGSPRQDRADGMSDADLRKKYGKDIIKKEEVEEGGPGSGPRHKEVTLTRNGKTKTVKGVAAKIFTDAGWKLKEEVELDEVHFSNRGEPPAPKGMHKLRSGRDIPSTPQVDKIHKKVVAMTDRNDHFGARIEIAKQLGDKQLVQIFSTLELIHDKYSGAVGNQAIELRNKFSPVLNNAIDRKFGKYADVIRDGL